MPITFLTVLIVPGKIVQRIKDLSTNRNTLKERMLSVNSDIENQLISYLNKSTFCLFASTKEHILSHPLAFY